MDVEQLLMQLDKIQMQLNFGRGEGLILSPLRFSASLSVLMKFYQRVISTIKQEARHAFYVNSLPIASMSQAIRSGNVDFALSTREIQHASIISKKIIIGTRSLCNA